MAAGVRQVLNVTPVSLPAESDVVVRQVDLALELQVLAFQASRGPRDDVKEAREAKPTRGHRGSAGHQGNVMGEETVTA